MTVLSPLGLRKIVELQNKYKYQNVFEIIEPNEVIDFLEGLRYLYYQGLNIDQEDIDWIENTLDVLTS